MGRLKSSTALKKLHFKSFQFLGNGGGPLYHYVLCLFSFSPESFLFTSLKCLVMLSKAWGWENTSIKENSDVFVFEWSLWLGVNPSWDSERITQSQSSDIRRCTGQVGNFWYTAQQELCEKLMRTKVKTGAKFSYPELPNELCLSLLLIAEASCKDWCLLYQISPGWFLQHVLELPGWNLPHV